MKKVIGSPGTVCGLLLRIGQCTSAAASMSVMLSSKKFYYRTAFSYLIASMCFQMLWSFWLACVNVYALRYKKDLQHLTAVSLFVGGDLVTAILSLAAACSSAGVVVLYARDIKYCDVHDCLRYEVAVALSFITWVQIAVSFHVSFWIYASV
ncbi:unnamed protein product [Brassica rapa]|uniref:CASP-like protein n=1 Tax=Brassica campestris TaxID=3711 RepID=A0A3P5YMK4_BRACM|nr:unnamed protein product [Brassica rapa]VDC62533.1 unnamed protein product [Brassica rapa]